MSQRVVGLARQQPHYIGFAATLTLWLIEGRYGWKVCDLKKTTIIRDSAC